MAAWVEAALDGLRGESEKEDMTLPRVVRRRIGPVSPTSRPLSLVKDLALIYDNSHEGGTLIAE